MLPPELAQNSIRHRALAPDGAVAFAMQWEGDPALPVPQLGLWRADGTLHLCPPPEDQALRMRGYAGSIAVATDGRIALTSPRGWVVMIHAADGVHLSSHARADICGVARLGAGFMASDGGGALWTFDIEDLRPLRRDGPAWDNHLVAIGQA